MKKGRGRKLNPGQIELIVAMHCAGFPGDYISKITGIGKKLIQVYTQIGSQKSLAEKYARNAGYGNLSEYYEALVQERGYKNYSDYKDALAQNKGYQDNAHMQRIRRNQKKRFCFAFGPR